MTPFEFLARAVAPRATVHKSRNYESQGNTYESLPRVISRRLDIDRQNESKQATHGTHSSHAIGGSFLAIFVCEGTSDDEDADSEPLRPHTGLHCLKNREHVMTYRYHSLNHLLG